MRRLLLAAALTTLLPAAASAQAPDGREARVRRRLQGRRLAPRHPPEPRARQPRVAHGEARRGAPARARTRECAPASRTPASSASCAAASRARVVALRADMDALPVTEQPTCRSRRKRTAEYHGEKVGVMHACGHDAHVAILMGVAEVLAGMREELPGTVMFVFQPAEEGRARRRARAAPTLMLERGRVQRAQARRRVRAARAAARSHRARSATARAAMAASDRFTHRREGPADARLAAVARRRSGASPPQT